MIARLFTLFLLGLLAASLSAQDQPSGVTIHVVQRGENLFRIALRYGFTTEALAEYNGIADPSSIQVGQRLLIPADTQSAAAQDVIHIVQAGETLRSIADFYGKTVDELSALNALEDVNAIYIGQPLLINQAANVPSVDVLAPEPAGLARLDAQQPSVFHIVQGGETLFRIAASYGLTVHELARANSITDPTLIYAGQQLIIPGVTPPHLALDLPEAISTFDVVPLILVEGNTGRYRITTTRSATVTGNFLGRPLAVAAEDNNSRHTAFAGIPVGLQAGIYPLNLTVADSDSSVTNFTVNIQVVSGGYGAQNITLPQEKMSLLAPEIENSELALLGQITSTFNPERYFDGPMGLPAAAAMNAPFGTVRAYNGGAFDRYHYGADFAGAPGSPILASAPGRVVLADTLAIRGIVTVIDHGWGVFSTYSHQAERYVQAGEFVTAGQVIGAVGSSGRATGAHLHWEIWVNGVPVDPLQWVSQVFS